MIIAITGVSKGLGLALAEHLINDGHTICGCARSEDRIMELSEKHSGKHSFEICDVSDFESVSRWAHSAVSEVGVPDILVNNAGLMNTPDNLWDIPPLEFEKIIQVNVCGVMYCTAVFVPHMIRKGSGIIVNMSSGWGRMTSAHVAPYCASKYAVEGMTHALSQELPEGLSTVALNPGVIDTEMLKKCWPGDTSHFIQPGSWAEKAADYILSLKAEDNGKSLTVSG